MSVSLTKPSEGTVNWSSDINGNFTAIESALNALGGTVVQVQYTQPTEITSVTNSIPIDDSIPQAGEGTQVMSVSITPTSTSNILLIFGNVQYGINVASYCAFALFTDKSTSAVKAFNGPTIGSSNWAASTAFFHVMNPVNTTAHTIKLEAGVNGAGTMTFNGLNGGRVFGAIPKSALVVVELKF